ncbi:B12-binding domain-containing radical SAM protein [Methanothermobacter sp. DP]|uniref:B12-binding domain-containing radical SAM protein n=1 Tax=Methanothermobacter sp. DP TaxID=2998972 RepID=UPI002AA5B886|nr:radical SAM protein [Methanothermobacter sp. DP]
MDVVLINPEDQTAVKNKLGFVLPPLNLMYLGAALERASFSVEIIDDDLRRMGAEGVALLVEKLNPLIVGITATTATIKTSLEYIKAIKRVLPDVLTVIGGPHPTFLPLETLSDCRELDVVVMGEGEETIVELAEGCERGDRGVLEGVKGISYRTDERLRTTPPRPLIENLDDIPFPARHLVPFRDYETSSQEAGGMITSRGCVYPCRYCSSSLIMGKKFRFRSPENVVDEVEELTEIYGLREIAFLDDTFMLHRPRAREIAEEIRRRDLDVSFVTSSRVDMVQEPLLRTLREAGMSTVYYGVESGCQRILDMMKKGITVKQSEDAVKAAKRAGLDVITSFILGYPGERPSEMDRTIDFSIKLDPDYSQYSILTPFPGTPIYTELKSKGLLEEDWDRYTVIQPVIRYEKLGLSRELIQRKLVKAYLKFYSRPSYLLKHTYMIRVFFETLYRTYIEPKIPLRKKLKA